MSIGIIIVSHGEFKAVFIVGSMILVNKNRFKCNLYAK